MAISTASVCHDTERLLTCVGRYKIHFINIAFACSALQLGYKARLVDSGKILERDQLALQRDVSKTDLFVDLIDPRHACERHTQLELLVQDVQAELDASLAFVCQSPEDRSTDPDHVCTKRQGFKDVGAMSDASVDVYWDPAAYNIDNVRQGV